MCFLCAEQYPTGRGQSHLFHDRHQFWRHFEHRSGSDLHLWLRSGIAGAAIATILSQLISFLILLSCFLRRKTIIRLHIRKVATDAETYLLIIKTGLPSLFRQGLASISTVLLNVNAAAYGDAAVAAMSIVGKCFMLIFSSLIGFGQGFQPVVGYNYGAKNTAACGNPSGSL